MNKILQKRIEEAARDFNRKEGIPYALTGHVFNAFIEGAAFALQNQWISVSEALPKKKENSQYSEYVCIRQEYYEHEHFCIARYDYNYKIWVSTFYFKPEFVTHWMCIPSLKRGEK